MTFYDFDALVIVLCVSSVAFNPNVCSTYDNETIMNQD